MFGTYRYVLALMVANGHIQFQLFGRPNWLGLYAVFGFYTLSGYLMTRVLHETYGYDSRGFLAYVSNRALRIYPPYWAAMAISIALLVLVPSVAGNQASLVHLPTSYVDYVRNFVLIGMTSEARPALVPISWSLHVELIFYVLMGLGLSVSRPFATFWLCLSVAWTAWALWSGLPFGARYSTVIGGSLPFSAGACAYFFSRPGPRWMWIAPILFLPHALAAPFLWSDVHTSGFYASFLLAPLCVLSLAEWRPSASLAQWDRRLGDLSYPIFLLHTHAGYLAPKVAPFTLNSPLKVFLIALPIMHVAGVLVHLAIVRPLEKVRRRVRPRGAGRPA